MIKAKEATIIWDENPNMTANSRVAVIPGPEKPGTFTTDWMNSHGSICAGWLEGDPYMTPEGQFAQALFGDHPTPNADTVKAWLREFAKIEECAWARTMLEVLTPPDPEE